MLGFSLVTNDLRAYYGVSLLRGTPSSRRADLLSASLLRDIFSLPHVVLGATCTCATIVIRFASRLLQKDAFSS